MSTIRATYVQHGSSAVPNITLNASGQVIVASGIVSSGTFAAPSGSVSAPGIYFNGDSNTGLYSPAADTIAFTEGGVEALRIDSSGRVGIGTSSVSAILHTKTAGGEGLRIQGAATSAFLRFTDASDASTGYIGQDSSFAIINQANTDMRFATNNTTRMTLTSGGSLGIGTTSPNQKFVLRESGATAVYMQWINNSDGKAAYAGLTSPGEFAIQTNNVIAFQTGGSYLERARIDDAGRLLVGTSTSIGNYFNQGGQDHQLQVVLSGSGAANTYMAQSWTIFNGGSAAEGCHLTLARAKSNTIGNYTAVSSGDTVGLITFQGSDGSEFVQAARIDCIVDGTPGANDMPGRLVFSTTKDGQSSPSEAFRVNSAQQICINRTTALAGGFISITAGSSTTQGIAIQSIADNNYALGFYNTTATNVGNITIGASSTSFVTSSDYRLKENIIPVPDGITRLQQLKPYRFNFIVDPDTTVDGFLAHEVQTVVPEAITGEKDAVDAEGNPIYQGIDQSKLLPLLTAALQEAIGRIEALEAEVAALKAQ